MTLRFFFFSEGQLISSFLYLPPLLLFFLSTFPRIPHLSSVFLPVPPWISTPPDVFFSFYRSHDFSFPRRNLPLSGQPALLLGFFLWSFPPSHWSLSLSPAFLPPFFRFCRAHGYRERWTANEFYPPRYPFFLLSFFSVALFCFPFFTTPFPFPLNLEGRRFFFAQVIPTFPYSSGTWDGRPPLCFSFRSASFSPLSPPFQSLSFSQEVPLEGVLSIKGEDLIRSCKALFVRPPPMLFFFSPSSPLLVHYRPT